jgi:20S proteasome alpha/beta subunit
MLQQAISSSGPGAILGPVFNHSSPLRPDSWRHPTRPLPRPLKQRYPWVSKEERMTIAVGFKCIDGVVLATDSQYSDDPAKTTGQKVFPIWSNGHYALTIAGAGFPDSIKGIARDMELVLGKTIGSREAGSAEIIRTIERVLRSFHAKHIDTAPPEERLELSVQLLIGLWTEREGTKLFGVNRTIAAEVSSHLSVGYGSYLTEYICDALIPSGWIGVEQATALAAYIVWTAKKYVKYCGGPTGIRVLSDSGKDIRIDQNEVEAGEGYFTDLFRQIGSIVGFLSRTPYPVDVEMGPFTAILKERLLQLRQQQAQFRDAARQRSLRREEDLPG